MVTSTSCNPSHLIISLSLCVLALCCNANPQYAGKLKGMFIFGTSVVDNGNNNNLITIAKVNYAPYGIDFPFGATGRFSNGKNVADLIGERLGLPLVPAFADVQARGGEIVHGVNHGSGGSGILDETGLILGKVISLNEQIDNFEGVTLPQLETQLRRHRRDILCEYLFLVAAGNNDYLLNYFMGGSLIYTPQEFAAKLISNYSAQLQRLYNLGARKFVVLSVYPLGCSPVVSRGQGCLPQPNAVVTIFYNQLITMVDQLNSQLPDSVFIAVNSVKIITDIINNAGFSNTSGPCCELSANGASCEQNGNVCNNRKSYVYFDGQHNTQALSSLLADKIYSSNDNSEVYPVNLRELVHAHP